MNRILRSACAAAPVLAIVALTSPAEAVAQGSLFQVESANQGKVLDVTEAAGFVVGGTVGFGGIPAVGAGVRLMWYPGKVAFRAGLVGSTQWDDAQVGLRSVAFGLNTTASGMQSMAMNSSTNASGTNSVAMNSSTTASGESSTAVGGGTVASGTATFAGGSGSRASGGAAVALGVNTVASGRGATALGEESQAAGGNTLAAGYRVQANGNASMATGTGTIASGAASVAMGSAVTAGGEGSFIFGDRNISYALTAAPNTFHVRAFGGVGINTGVDIGCDLPAGTGAWACTSSRLTKEGFTDVDGEAMLTRLAAVPIQRWRYIGTEADHLGPAAEDFHAAFGLGESDTKIATVDANGVALRSVQALERRTAELREENAALRAELAALRGELRMLLRAVGHNEDQARGDIR